MLLRIREPPKNAVTIIQKKKTFQSEYPKYKSASIGKIMLTDKIDRKIPITNKVGRRSINRVFLNHKKTEEFLSSSVSCYEFSRVYSNEIFTRRLAGSRTPSGVLTKSSFSPMLLIEIMFAGTPRLTKALFTIFPRLDESLRL